MNGPVSITFLGGEENGGVDKTVWGTDTTGRIEFPLRTAIVVDPSKGTNGPEKAFLAHVIQKASGNSFFKVEPGAKGQPAKVIYPGPRAQPIARKRRSKVDDAEDEAAAA